MLRLCAARPKCNSSPTATKQRSWANSNIDPDVELIDADSGLDRQWCAVYAVDATTATRSGRERMKELTGESLIGARRAAGQPGAFRGVNPATGENMEPAYSKASAAEVDEACALAWAAFDTFR